MSFEPGPMDGRLLGLFERLRKLAFEQLSAEDVGISMAQLVLLDGIAASPGCRVSDVAEGLDLTAPTVSVGVRRLENEGLVERRPDPDDGRVTQLFVTARGQTLHDRGLAFRLGKMRRLLGGLTSKEREDLLALLRKAVEGAERAEQQDAAG